MINNIKSLQALSLVVSILSEHRWVRRILFSKIIRRIFLELLSLIALVMSKRYSAKKTAILTKVGIILKNLSDESKKRFTKNGYRNPAIEWISNTEINPETVKFYVDRFNSWSFKSQKRFIKLNVNILLSSFKHYLENRQYDNLHDGGRNLRTLILAQFDKCNLNCVGCYTNIDRDKGEVSFEQLDYIIDQAESLNVVLTVVVGKGEPFYNSESTDSLLKLIKLHPRMTFIIFTNGTTIGKRVIKRISRLHNVIPVISIDGLEKIHDARRGKGVYNKLRSVCREMNNQGIFYGYASTIYAQNYQEVTSAKFVDEMKEFGAMFGINFRFVYIPTDKNSDSSMVLSPQDLQDYLKNLSFIQNTTPIPLIDSDSAEQNLGGCLSRRGNLIYIDAITGSVSPCVKTPFAPKSSNIYLDSNNNRLREILNTEFFTAYRSRFPDYYQCGIDYERELKDFRDNTKDLTREEENQLFVMIDSLNKTKQKVPD